MTDYGIRVKLTKDLTKYGEGLVLGMEGVTIPPCSKWALKNERFMGILFDNGCKLDVLWDSLEILDKKYVKKHKEDKEKVLDAYGKALKATRFVGPRGGLKSLSLTYQDGESIEEMILSNKGKIKEIEKRLHKNHVPIQEIVC